MTEIDGMDNYIASRIRVREWWGEGREEDNLSCRDNNRCIKYRLPTWTRRHRGRMTHSFLVSTCIFIIMIALLSVAAMENNGIIDIIRNKRGNRVLQSPIMINGGDEAARHRFRMHTSYLGGSKSGKGGKSSSSKSDQSVSMIVYQPIYVTPPTSHYYHETKPDTPTPTAAPEEVTEMPTYRPSASPFTDETISPTAELTSVKRKNLQMSLFGISKSVLDVNQQQYFERQTATYMEEFYNKADGWDGLLDVIKDEVTDVEVTVTIDDQKYKYTDIRTLTFNKTQTGYNGDRNLRVSKQVSEPCEGTDPLLLTFSVDISYRLSSGKYPIESDAVINFPFSSVPYRQNYIDDYLKNNGAADSSEETDKESNIEGDEEAGAVFADVYCTSRIDTETDNAELPRSTSSPTDSPTLSPTLDESLTPSILPSALPSALPSILPSVLSNAPITTTLPPTFPSTSAKTGVPSTSKAADASSGSPTYVQPMSVLSAAPSLVNGAKTVFPTTKSSARLTTVAPTSAVPTPSQFSLSVRPSLSTSTAGTAVPTSNVTTRISSAPPTVAFDDNVGPADTLSVVEESLGLTLSPRPTIVGKNITIVPTTSGFLNEAPSPALSNPPTLQSSDRPSFSSSSKQTGASIPPTTQSSNRPTFSSSSKQTGASNPPTTQSSNRPTFSSSSNQSGFEATTSGVPSPSSSSGETSGQLQQNSVSTPSPTNGMFGNLRAADPAANERVCSDTLRLVPEDERDEIGVAFVYSVEYTSDDIHDYIDDMETFLLDLVSKSVLECATAKNENGAGAVASRKLETENPYEGVLGVRYPEFGKITSTSYCKTVTSSQANGCAILLSKLIITSVGVSNVEVHHNILLILENIFKESRMVEVVPDLLKTSYLGSDPSALVLSTVPSTEPNCAQRSTYASLLLAILFGCSLLYSM